MTHRRNEMFMIRKCVRISGGGNGIW
jgi:hypothetical protein